MLRRLLLLFAAILLISASSSAQTTARRMKAEMECLYHMFGVNFVYDSSLDIDVPYQGKPMKELAAKGDLDLCLQTLFQGSEFTYELLKKYVVVTMAYSWNKPKDYTILIEEQYDAIDESVVTADVDAKRNITQTGLKRIDSKDINSGFALFNTPDVVKTLQMMPGVASGTELLSGFYVHGGDGSDNLFLLDGVPIYQISHFAGLFSSFNTDVISSLDFYKSGFPARYGSKMSSVVDVTAKDGNFKDYHGTFALGIIDGRLQFEGPIWKDRTSFNIGLRRTWTETVTLPAFAIINRRNKPDKQFGGYSFTDLNAKITHKFSDSSKLSANFYYGNDAIKYRNDNVMEYYDSDNNYHYSRDRINISFSWGNILGSLNWDHKVDDRLSMRTMAYYSGSDSDLGFSFQDIDKQNNSSKSGEYNSSAVHNIGVKSDWHWDLAPKQKLRYGAAVQYHIYSPNAISKADYVIDGKAFTRVAYSDSLNYGTVEASVYAEDEISLTDRFTLNAGLRYSLYSAGRTWHSLEPRVAMKYSFNDKLSAKASYTEMSQPTHLVSSMYLDLPTNSWLPSTSKIRPSRSREVAGGVYSNISHHLHLNVEGWYKHMYNLLEYAGSYSIFPPLTGWEDCYGSGMGRSWGAELDFGFDNGITEANVYYTLSWSQRKFDDFYQNWYRDRNDNRHKLTLMAKHKFGKRFELYGAWNYHSGNRITMATHEVEGTGESYRTFDVYSQPNNVKLPDYHRLDLGFNFIRHTRRGNVSTWNLSVYNAYCRVNPITAYSEYAYVYGEKVAYYGAGVGMIPVIPTFGYTLKF